MAELRITMQQIAEACGVSKQAVSLALNGKPGVSNATAERIRATAEEMGYVPDPILRSLVRYRMRSPSDRGADTMAFVHAFPSDGWKRHLFYGPLFHGIRKRAGELGYKVEEFRLNPEMTEKQLSRILIYRGIRILLLAPQPQPGAVVLENLDLDAFVPVGLGNTWEQSGLSVVSPFHFQSVQIAFRKLQSMGVKRCALLLDPRNHHRDHGQYLGGFVSAYPSGDAPPVYVDPDQSERRLMVWLEQNKPDGVIAIGPDLNAWSRNWARGETPQVRVASLGVLAPEPGHLGVDQQVAGIGRTAVEVAHSRLQGGLFGASDPVVEMMVPGVWVHGQS